VLAHDLARDAYRVDDAVAAVRANGAVAVDQR